MKKLLLLLFITVSIAGFSQQSIDVRVTSATDDAEECIEDNVFVNIGDVTTDNPELELIYDDNVIRLTHLKIGLLFRNINIPQGAIITNAFLKFTCKQSSSDIVNLFIQGQNSDNPETFMDNSWDISSRPLTTSGINWAPQGWYVVDESGTSQRTPDLSSIIQEIVDRSAWVNGNSIAFVVSGTGKSRTAYSYDGESTKAPLLHIEYSFVGVDDLNKSFETSFSPNPASSFFNLKMNPENNKNIVFKIFNQLGEEVEDFSYINNGDGSYRFDIQSIKNGICYLSICTKESKKAIKIIISNN
jgi:hypothetical protein